MGNPAALGNAYNVNGDELLTWRSMHTIVAEELGAPTATFLYIPTETLGRLAPVESEWCLMNFQYNNIFENHTAKRVLGFASTVSYREGVRRCLKALTPFPDEATPDFYEGIVKKFLNR
jgi:nucleoside-diphosphate-sugar epimerase